MSLDPIEALGLNELKLALRTLILIAALWAPAMPLRAQSASNVASGGSDLRTAPLGTQGRVYDITEKGEPLAPTTQTLAAAADHPVSSTTMRALRELEAFNKKIKTVQATFDQKKVDEVLTDVIKTPGTLWYEKPTRFRIDYDQPQPMVTLITEDTLYNYLPQEKQVEYYTFASAEERDQQLQHLLLAFGFNADELARRYEIRSSADDPALRGELEQEKLSPENKTLFFVKPRPAYEENCPFKQMKVTVDKASHKPEKIWYKDLSDVAITLAMTAVTLDPQLPGKVFDKDAIFPKGVDFIDKRNAK